MEKIMSVEERIKRAEEIYNNRVNDRGSFGNTYRLNKKNDSRRFNKIKKMLIQIVVCFVLYVAFYIISNNEYVFSNDFKEGIISLLNTQMDFNKMYNDCRDYFWGLFSTDNNQNVDNVNEKDNIHEVDNDVREDVQNVETNEIDSENRTDTSDNGDINIGGANMQVDYVGGYQDLGGDVQGKSQMEIDAEDIKNSISFEIPVNGYISSTFGLRSPTTATVPKNHTGLDIAANDGTVIKSATDGVVILASSYGDYGNHYKIQIDDVIIIYAHCKKLYLKEGDIVKQGQEIAEVGSTGNSTGPHLHFEIRKDGRLIDPQLILDI